MRQRASGGTLALFPGLIPDSADSTDAQNTPRDLAAELGRFDLDVCSNPRSHVVAARSFMLERGEDGLAEAWECVGGAVASVWCNGPYSYPDPWCERLALHRGPWAALWKLDPTTRWFAVLATAADAWAPFRKRLAFERPGNCGSADFPSVLAWGGGWKPSRAVLRRLWAPRRERR